MNKALMLIVTHNLVTRLVSKGLAIAFGAFIFMESLNMHICKSKRLAMFKGSTTYNNEGFILFA
jgi:hypothetical protein